MSKEYNPNEDVMSTRRSFIQGLLAVPLALRFGSVLAAKSTVQEPLGPTVKKMEVREGWKPLPSSDYLDSQIFQYTKTGKIVSVPSTVVASGYANDALRNFEWGMR